MALPPSTSCRAALYKSVPFCFLQGGADRPKGLQKERELAGVGIDGLEGSQTFVNCACGKVSLSLPCKSVQRFECCCCDCQKALHWSHKTKGGAPPPPVADLVYYPNILMATEGREYLRCFTLQKDFPSRRVYASCCWTPLIADNPAYECKRLAVYNGPAHLKVMGLEVHGQSPLRPADDRIRQSDMTSAELSALPPFRQPSVQRTWVEATAAAEAAIRSMQGASGGWKPQWRMWDLVTVLTRTSDPHPNPDPRSSPAPFTHTLHPYPHLYLNPPLTRIPNPPNPSPRWRIRDLVTGPYRL